jgi:hypothetical protein
MYKNRNAKKELQKDKENELNLSLVVQAVLWRPVEVRISKRVNFIFAKTVNQEKLKKRLKSGPYGKVYLQTP